MASQEKWLWTYAVSIRVNDTSELFLWNIERLTVLGASALPELQTVPEVELLNVLNACFFLRHIEACPLLFWKVWPQHDGHVKARRTAMLYIIHTLNIMYYILHIMYYVLYIIYIILYIINYIFYIIQI